MFSTAERSRGRHVPTPKLVWARAVLLLLLPGCDTQPHAAPPESAPRPTSMPATPVGPRSTAAFSTAPARLDSLAQDLLRPSSRAAAPPTLAALVADARLGIRSLPDHGAYLYRYTEVQTLPTCTPCKAHCELVRNVCAPPQLSCDCVEYEQQPFVADLIAKLAGAAWWDPIPAGAIPSLGLIRNDALYGALHQAGRITFGGCFVKLAAESVRDIAPEQREFAVMLGILAHEYGHYADWNRPTRWELSKRFAELQHYAPADAPELWADAAAGCMLSRTRLGTEQELTGALRTALSMLIKPKCHAPDLDRRYAAVSTGWTACNAKVGPLTLLLTGQP